MNENLDLLDDQEFWDMVSYVQQFDPNFASELADILKSDDNE